MEWRHYVNLFIERPCIKNIMLKGPWPRSNSLAQFL